MAVNPAKNFREAANTQRSANLNAIMNAIGQYTVDKKGDLTGLSLPSANSERVMGDGSFDGASGMGGSFDTFCEALVPNYIGALPVDPINEEYQSIPEDDCDNSDITTFYTIEVDGGGHITLTAPATKNVDTGATSTNPITLTR